MSSYASAIVVTAALLAVACGTSSTSTKGDGAMDDADGPMTCEAPCQECAAFACACADGASIQGCACDDGGRCFDSRACASGLACRDHGGNATRPPGEPVEEEKDGGDEPSSGGTLTITAHFGSIKALHDLGPDKKTVGSVLSLAGTPSFSPSKPSTLPNLAGAAVVDVISPSRGACSAPLSFTLNGSKVGVVISADDTLPSTACASFTDAAAATGLRATLRGISNASGDVKVVFLP